MVFACQQDSFLKELTTTVVSSVQSTKKVVINGKSEKVSGFDVILEDTVIFPEGGGQPYDKGTIDDIPILCVTRKGGDAIHFIKNNFEVGAAVKLVVDWNRRFDHMQQHSGQHLISAVTEKMYGYKTTSWYLGEDSSFIELDTSCMKSEEMAEIERLCNEHIRSHLNVVVKVYEENADELKQAKTRGLPEDHVGSVRVICIEGVDENMCCGTHVSNLSQLQVVKLISADKGKKGKTNLSFLVGQRVMNFVAQAVNKDKQFTDILKCGPQEHTELLIKMHKSLKLTQKNELNFLRELASAEAQQFKLKQPKPNFFSLHRKDGNADFMSIIVNEIADENVLIFLSIGEQNACQLLLAGQPSLVKELGPKVMEILDGKGVANGNKFNGKFKNLNRRQEAEDLLRQNLQN